MGSCQSKSLSTVNSKNTNDEVCQARGWVDKKQHHGEPSVTSTHAVTEELRAEQPIARDVAEEGVNNNKSGNVDGAPATCQSGPESGWHERPGYSSGASSRDGSVRASDRLHLQSMRDDANGDLTTTVVPLQTPFGKTIEEIYDGVYDGPELGRGVAGIVRKVKHRKTEVEYACKRLDLRGIDTEAGLRQLRNEISIMCQLDHPNIVRIEEVYEATDTIYLVQELCIGGELFDRLEQQDDLHYTEATCARLVKQIVSAVRYLHSKGVIHRDLKLENFLFSSKAPASELRMIDFGLSKHFESGDVQNEQVGSRYTCSPEILKGRYDEKCDIWAIGVITYLLLCGDAPFGGCYEEECLVGVRNNILNGSIPFEPADIWEDTSDLSRQFVRKLLNVDPTKRPSAKEVQRDEWLRTFAARGASRERNRLNPRIVQALVNFKGYSEMRRLLHEVLSFTLLPEQIVELREEFQKIDTDSDGEITIDELKGVLINTAGGGALGGLTEEEVEDLFNALKVNKTDSTIRWHGFIAAGLSQCQVDNRNLRLCFDRLDSDRKGYICIEDITHLLGKSPETLESVKKMWKESMHQCSCKMERISYDDFLLLMKGQARRESYRQSIVWTPQRPLLRPEDQAMLEALADESGDDSQVEDTTETPIKEGRIELPPRIEFGQKRSKSLHVLSSGPHINRLDESRPSTTLATSIPADFGLERPTPLLAAREEYKKHRDLRMAILEASQEFDTKDLVRHTTTPLQKAGLIMKRGSEAPQDLEDMHQRALFDAAIRRGGRQGLGRQVRTGHRKKRTQSDITGLLNAGVG